jgi:hypothetical protein
MSVAPPSTPRTPSAPDSSIRGVMRVLASLLPGANLSVAGDSSFDGVPLPSEPTRTIGTVVIEPGAMRGRRVFDPPEPGFAAFLDGTQSSRVLYASDTGVPVMHGTVAAVIRERRNKRLYTWRHIVEQRVYAPRSSIPDALWKGMQGSGIELRDTSDADGEAPTAGGHPIALRDAAIHRLQKDRERAEVRLAGDWCERERRPILIDGGISGSDRVAASSCAVGVVKTHRTLYAEGDALAHVLGLRQGERSSVFRITSPKRMPVASWYLRLRDRSGADPMWGLVRVEIAHPDRADEPAVGARADQVSRWILAEVAPIALPDARWDKMVYGIRDCEEFLRAVM